MNASEVSKPFPAIRRTFLRLTSNHHWLALFAFGLACVMPLDSRAQNNAAYGTINNFDVVNGTGTECHGFEIEIEDVHSQDITYTYNWNHYGTPSISEDNSDPTHSRVYIRYAAILTNGSWSSYTAIPTNPIAPTDGHRFTDPSINFGGEHFGCGYRGSPTNITYFWLIDDGAGHLVRGPSVNVATPIFTYDPPAQGQVAQVRAVIAAPRGEQRKAYGPATWVKEIKTKTRNNHEVKLRDLVSDDPDDDHDKNWRNEEEVEVETEWKLMQTRFAREDGGKNDKLEAKPERLNKGDEVITRRYEFFKYVGPLDPEDGEALTEDVGPDNLHGIDEYANVVIVGEYLGAQMSAFDINAPVGLIEHLQNGVVNEPYPRRTIVIQGNQPFIATNSGVLPDGMTFDNVTGELFGTPTVSGVFTLIVGATAGDDPPVRRTYTFTIAEAPDLLPLRSTIDTTVSPANGGTTLGEGTFDRGTVVTVTAVPAAGFQFVNWTEQGKVVSLSLEYSFTNEVNRDLVATFVPAGPALNFVRGVAGALNLTWPKTNPLFKLETTTSLNNPHWEDVKEQVVTAGNQYQVTVKPQGPIQYYRLTRPNP